VHAAWRISVPNRPAEQDPLTGHASDSAVQRTAEIRILELAGEHLSVGLVHRVWSQAQTRLAAEPIFDCDGYCPDPLIYAEVFGRQGALKGGQIHKVAQDILKLTGSAGSSPPPAGLSWSSPTMKPQRSCGVADGWPRLPGRGTWRPW